MRMSLEEPSVVIDGARERVIGASVALVTLAVADVACALAASQARRLAGELLAAAAALEELS